MFDLFFSFEMLMEENGQKVQMGSFTFLMNLNLDQDTVRN